MSHYTRTFLNTDEFKYHFNIRWPIHIHSSSWHEFYCTSNSLVESIQLITVYGQSSTTEYAGIHSTRIKLVKHTSRNSCTNNRILAHHASKLF